MADLWAFRGFALLAQSCLIDCHATTIYSHDVQASSVDFQGNLVIRNVLSKSTQYLCQVIVHVNILLFNFSTNLEYNNSWASFIRNDYHSMMREHVSRSLKV